jgi:peptide/nickel transport system substrate-binding protein
MEHQHLDHLDKRRRKMKRHKWYYLVAICLAMVFMLGACGGTAAEDEPESVEATQAATEPVAGTEQTEETEVEAVEEVEEVEAADSGPSGTLRYGNNILLTSYNPWFEQAPAFFAVYQIMFEGLLIQDTHGQIVPLLATSWQYNDDQTELTLTLREGVVFHDGTPFNAEVAAANLNYIKNDLEFPPAANQLNFLEEIEIVDDFTIVLHLSQPDMALVPNLARNVGIMISPDYFETARQEPIGTGPWRLITEESTVDGTLIFEAFEEYWDPSVQGVQRIEYVQIPDNNARLNALFSGELDISAIQSSQAQSVEDEGLAVAYGLSTNFGIQITDLNGEVIPQLADKEFRCGISQAIDRQAVAEVLFNGLAHAGVQREIEGQYGYLENPPDVGFNPEAAREKLAGNEGLEITTGAWGPFNFIAQAAAGGLAEFGDITLNIEAIQSSQMWPSLAQNVYPIVIVPYSEAHLITAIRNRAVNGAFNPSGYVPEGVAELLAQAENLPEAEAEPIIEEIKSIMIEECIWLPVVTGIGAIGYNQDVVPLVEHRDLYPTAIQIRGLRMATDQ